MFVQGSHLQNVCLNLAFLALDWFLSKKKDICSYIWPRSFSEMVNCSLLDKKIVYQSVCGALLMFSYFLLLGKVLCFACVSKSLSRCWFPKTLLKKLHLQLYLTQTVHLNNEVFFLSPYNCISKFLLLNILRYFAAAALTLSLPRKWDNL